MSFWHTLSQPIIGLSPMDGVTDAAFRFIMAQHGKPDVQCTEFIDVEEIRRGTASAWRQLRFVESERPILAQIYGADPDGFYQVAHVLCALGFDGVDINMGCPSKSVSARGCGAALIKNPLLARAIIRAVQAGVRDWASGQAIDTIGLRSSVVEQIQRLTSTAVPPSRQHRSALPVSIKNGVLIGRGVLGNPWIFRAKAWARQQLSTPTAEAPLLDVALRERCQVALEHARYFEGLNDGVPFQAMRKHLGWYCRGFPGAADLRAQLFTTTTSGDVARVFATLPLDPSFPSPTGRGLG